ncbi:cystathionine gamma-synthase family protein [Brumimicrobium aurantiacum]|uniref:Cystathionine gamma-synthase family protein n=1 Tax=Brumimicrobium aurantiacum TaxID=1737063 RepID=A0A3E1EWH7_9FLAO|nr:cystathionine gamma-synthase family protein [Brumimicrobium aurantiacum]RFC53914.1 cystathionine gamma-synthase family protein [Brumimicrobium aurantiacum]
MKKNYKPESLMMSHGYKPELSEGSIKCPIFQTSTFVFKTAEEGKAYFELAYGLREKNQDEELGLIYSRINNPNLEILENRLTLWDKADDSAVFESGMSAISTVLLEFLKPGDLLLYSSPTYGGTDHFIHDFLPKIGVDAVAFHPEDSQEDIEKILAETGKADKLGLIYIETPANPTNSIIDIEMCNRLAKKYSSEDHRTYVCVDNTYMGPVWSKPLEIGADLVVYSATKFIGGHSDLIAGAVMGNAELMIRVKTLRTFLGNMVSPHTAWLMLRSLETLKIRMEKQSQNAQKVANFLNGHEKVEKVHYLGLIDEESPYYELYKRQYNAPGAMISFLIKGGEKEAFQFLNSLNLIQLAVSLGSTESLAQHPQTMTHCAIEPKARERMGVTANLVRVSIGVEDAEDIIHDVSQALDTVK